MSSSGRPKPSRKSSSNHRPTLSLQKTEIRINVYDLLPPGKIATMLWAIGGSLLHSGVVINDKEYAYGGHDQHGMTGVYFTKPGLEPPGGTFRTQLLHGFSFRPEEELQKVILEASQRFQGTSYNLLTRNCNHFSSYLCEKLTGRPAPSWLNRAASIGVALPCVVPSEWIAPPDHDTADGELLDEEDERSSMLRSEQRQRQRASEDDQESWDNKMDRISSSSSGGPNGQRRYGTARNGAPSSSAATKDVEGRQMPPAERAPLPRRIK